MDTTMPFDVLPTAGLATTAFARLTEFFATTTHRPSAQQFAAIRDLMEKLEMATRGELETALYLSPIPAGTGKTSALIHFAAALMDSPDHHHVGMLITVNRVTEIKEVAEKLSRHRSKICVIASSDDKAEAMGAHQEAAQAQLCICTQASLKRTLKSMNGAPFADATRFHYRGQRRAVVCWDEGFAFNRPVVLDGDTVAGLAKAMRRQSDAAATALLRWSVDVAEHTAGLIAVPDFEAMGVDFGNLEDAVGDRDELVAQAKALAVVNGDRGYVYRQGGAAAIVTHFPEIPRSLMPVIITDASARVNESYKQMNRKGTPIVWMEEAPKTYRNMSIHLVNAAASRSIYRDVKTTRGRDLLDIASKYIQSVPASEKVLVIGYKGRFNMRGVDPDQMMGTRDEMTDEGMKEIQERVERGTLQEALLNRVKPADRSRVRYLTYGRHTATNVYSHVKHVFLLGLNFMPKAAGHAASGAALDLDLKEEHPTAEQVEQTQQGLLMDTTLQAVLRGNARNGVDGDCGVMEVVIPQSKQAGLSVVEYHRCFPEAVITYDQVQGASKSLPSRLKQLSGIVKRRLKAGETVLTNPSLYEELGMGKQQFGVLVKGHEWQTFIQSLGLRPQRLPGRVSGLKLIA